MVFSGLLLDRGNLKMEDTALNDKNIITNFDEDTGAALLRSGTKPRPRFHF